MTEFILGVCIFILILWLIFKRKAKPKSEPFKILISGGYLLKKNDVLDMGYRKKVKVIRVIESNQQGTIILVKLIEND